jgi:hypothetical protein
VNRDEAMAAVGRRRIHHKTCLLYDYDPRLTSGLDETIACRCPEPYPCGHNTAQRGCGGCDPGAIEWVKDDDGPWRILDFGDAP